MKEVVCISGKGGTGKTSLSAAFAYLAKDNAVVADCDVDAADLHLLLNPNFEYSSEFFSGEKAVIIQENCIQCGKCAEICRFDAVNLQQKTYIINELNCEGCGYCARVCPSDAIINVKQNVGHLFISQIKTGNKMIHAKLKIGADNSGKLVAEVKKTAKQTAEENACDFIIVDGSPGLGCPVISSLSGANYVVLITEPTMSGLHDLKRVYDLVEKFKLKAACIINKFDLNNKITKDIKDFLNSKHINHLADIPYHKVFTQAITNGLTVIECGNQELNKIIKSTWEKIKNNII